MCQPLNFVTSMWPPRLLLSWTDMNVETMFRYIHVQCALKYNMWGTLLVYLELEKLVSLNEVEYLHFWQLPLPAVLRSSVCPWQPVCKGSYKLLIRESKRHEKHKLLHDLILNDGQFRCTINVHWSLLQEGNACKKVYEIINLLSVAFHERPLSVKLVE